MVTLLFGVAEEAVAGRIVTGPLIDGVDRLRLGVAVELCGGWCVVGRVAAVPFR